MRLLKGLNMNTTDEFIKAWEMLNLKVSDLIEYRFHYNENGDIIMCSMQNHPKDTQYLVVTEKEYNNYYQYVVVNNKLKKIDNDAGQRVQLKRSSQGYRVVQNHAGIVLTDDEEYRDIEYYDNN